MNKTDAAQKVQFALFIAQALAALLLVISIFIQSWPFELIVSFTRLAVILLTLSLILSTFWFIYFNKGRASGVQYATLGTGWTLGLFALIFSLTVVKPVEVASEPGPQVTFATFNKYYGNTRLDEIAEYFKVQNVDILALQETQPEEVQKIAEQLGFEYSFSSRRLATAVRTVTAVISRYPIESAKTVNLSTNHPVVRAVVATPENGNVVFYSVHIPVPITPKQYEKRNRVTESLAKQVKKESLPVIIGGDINTTHFSPSLRAFTNGVNSILQPVITEHWPACSWYGLGQALCIRIDHIYVPRNALLTNFTISPHLGSDHRALIATVRLETM